MNRKVFVNLLGLAALILSSLGIARAQDDSLRCDNQTLKGRYGFTIEGTKLAGAGPIGTQVGVALANFGGDGNFTQIDSVTINGTSVSDFTRSPANGSYTVNGDCTGTFTILFTDGRAPVTADFVVVNNGDEIDTVVKGVGSITGTGGTQGILATRSIGKRVSGRRESW